MKKALIISLNFNPGHLSHLIASYKQCAEIGFQPFYLVDERFLPFISKSANVLVYKKDTINIQEVAVAFFHFPSIHNIALIRLLNKNADMKTFYFFHEPFESLSVYRKAGTIGIKLLKQVIAEYISRYIVAKSTFVVLLSQKAYTLYKKNTHYKNINTVLIPLLFDDEACICSLSNNRYYFSYIGTVAADHSFDEFVNVVSYIIRNNLLPQLKFMIATKSIIPNSDEMDYIRKSDRIKIKEGIPLTNVEINKCYAESICVWNAYTRTTQSGVLAKAFMFGTPALVLKKNLSNMVEEGKDVVAINDNKDFEEICSALNILKTRFTEYSNNCRTRFLHTYYYRLYNDLIAELCNKV